MAEHQLLYTWWQYDNKAHEYSCTYCRESILSGMAGYFIGNRTKNNVKIIFGYRNIRFSDEHVNGLTNIANTYKKLYGVDVIVSKDITLDESDTSNFKKEHHGLFITIEPQDKIVSAEMVSSMLLLLYMDETRDYLAMRDTTNVDLDTILFRLLNRAKDTDYDYMTQLQATLDYIKFVDKSVEQDVGAYYDGCLTFMECLCHKDDKLQDTIYNFNKELVHKLKPPYDTRTVIFTAEVDDDDDDNDY